MKRFTALLLASTLLSGCVVGPNYKRPAVTTPDKYYLSTESAQASIADLPWWEVFKDPALQALIEEGLKNNYDVRIAATRIEQAREQLAIAHSLYYPQVGYGASVTGRRQPGTRTGTYYGYNFPVSWEIDFWGRLRRINEEQRAALLATEEARRFIYLSLVSQIATGYFQLRAEDEQLAIAERTAQSYQETLDLFNKRFTAGVASGLDTSRAEGSLASVRAQVPDFRRRIVAQENVLNVLLGRPPGPIARGLALGQLRFEAEVPTGLPSTLLERRPDIRQAEQQLIAANAEIGVQRANFFPVIDLTGAFGASSVTLTNLAASGVAWSLGGVASGPIYTGGRLTAQYKTALAARDEAELNWRSTLNQALNDVTTNLSAHKELADSVKDQTRAVEALRESVRLSTIRYESGFSSYFEVIDAQQQLYPAENALVVFDLGRKLAFISLYQSLGGGWKLKDADWTNPAGVATPGGTPAATATEPKP